MSKSIRILCLLVFSLLFTIPAAAQQATPTVEPPLITPETFASQIDPAALVGSYYNAISRGEYERAYRYWETAPNNQTLQQFTAGFADTLSAAALVRLPIYGDAGAGSVYASVPTLLIAAHRDGGVVFYTGCLTAHKSNVPAGNATEPDPNWYLREGSLTQQRTLNLNSLDSACIENGAPPIPDGQADPLQLVQSYYGAINLNDYQRAFDYWESPPRNQTLEQFTAGFADTLNANVFVGLPIQTDAGAGNIYASIPMLVVAARRDGSVVYFAGCLTAHKSNVPAGNATEPDPNWYLREGELVQVADAISAVNTVIQGCLVAG
jgi:hypothetical protein